MQVSHVDVVYIYTPIATQLHFHPPSTSTYATKRNCGGFIALWSSMFATHISCRPVEHLCLTVVSDTSTPHQILKHMSIVWNIHVILSASHTRSKQKNIKTICYIYILSLAYSLNSQSVIDTHQNATLNTWKQEAADSQNVKRTKSINISDLVNTLD